jgi:GxxExxY protein
MEGYEHDELTQKIIGCCFEVHRSLGPGFIEKIYAKALQIELNKSGLRLKQKKNLMFIFKNN